jgi:acetyl-CoA synthase
VSIISPERVSPCGQCNWLDARASFALNPAGPRRPIKLGKAIDAKKGIWEGTNKYAESTSHGRVKEIALYSIMESPVGACGDFECIVMLIPEANGVMVVAHDYTSVTPAGISIATFASLTAGEQVPGVIGVGKDYLLSPKFILPDGGFKRVVWMSSVLKESMSDELKAVCEREGDPALMGKIADECQVTSVEELLAWLKAHKHPALEMERMF